MPPFRGIGSQRSIDTDQGLPSPLSISYSKEKTHAAIDDDQKPHDMQVGWAGESVDRWLKQSERFCAIQ
jgi:hypothetical protein